MWFVLALLSAVFVITLILAFALLHETMTVKSIVGAVLITAGTLVMVHGWSLQE